MIYLKCRLSDYWLNNISIFISHSVLVRVRCMFSTSLSLILLPLETTIGVRHNRHTVKKSSFIKKSSKKKYYLILFLFNLIFLSIFWINFYYCNIIISKLSSIIKILMTSKYKSCIILQYKHLLSLPVQLIQSQVFS